MQPDAPLPPFNLHGYLPEGVHETTFEAILERFVTNPQRTMLWGKLQQFLREVISSGKFSYVYIDGGFVTRKASPEDIDVILQPRVAFGPDAFHAIEPFYKQGIGEIHSTYSVHLHFWIEGFPDGAADFRRFFQYLRPQDAAPLGLREGARKGIVRIAL